MTASELFGEFISGIRRSPQSLTKRYGKSWHEPMRHLISLKLLKFYPYDSYSYFANRLSVPSKSRPAKVAMPANYNDMIA